MAFVLQEKENVAQLETLIRLHCPSPNCEKIEDRYPVLQDPTLVRAGQLACLRLLTALPSSNKAEFVTKMYAGIERKFNQLLRERVHFRSRSIKTLTRLS